MSATATFSTQILGQTEKALGAILDRQLAGTGLTEPQWVTLSLAVAGSEPVPADQFTRRVAGVLKVGEQVAGSHVTKLVDASLAQLSDGVLAPTDAGRRLHTQVRTAIVLITDRMWGDLPPDELATAGRVLSVVLDRANRELAETR